MDGAGVAVGALGWLVAVVLAALLVLAWRHAGARAELVARAGHELRGPLLAAELALHGLGRRGVPVGPVRAELDRARLALADLEVAPTGRLAVEERRVVDVAALVRAHAAAWEAVAAAGGATLRVDAGRAGAASVRVDPRRLAQAVGNLVANAAEHGGGLIDVEVRRLRDRVWLEVRDRGPGLPAPVDRLVAARARRGRRGRGRGLGVAMGVAQAAGGRLRELPGGPGARLVLELPAAAPAASLPAHAGAAGRAPVTDREAA